MRMRKPERTGIEVSACCLGTMMSGKRGNPDHDDCVGTIHQALDAGNTVVDTAGVSLTRTGLRRRRSHEPAAA
ncbi:hypothetical protein [Streptomyces sp. NPDC004629]|uniref:hypothetical protein n=1 Tax=Streptomyces sp. NPDC004629 TaxID=3364705 RepID=UPI0036B00076